MKIFIKYFLKISGGGWLQTNHISWTQQGNCKHDHRAIETVYTRPMQVQAKPNPSTETKLGHKTFP